MDHMQLRERLRTSRGKLPYQIPPSTKLDEEGGCGVTGFIATIPIRGGHLYEPSVQMHNRGNGKGGGLAAVGLCAEDLGVTQEVLESHYLIQIAFLNSDSRPSVEASHITPFFNVHKSEQIPSLKDYREIGLEVKPPDVWRYFVRVKKEVLDQFSENNKLIGLDADQLEDEFVNQNTFRLNQEYYASLGEKQAFVLSHGKNIMILKIVGYAEQTTQYYKLDDFKAHGWIAHQRYPTRGRMWHPGGAHPFSGMHEALVHNGDFANYHAISEYLRQHNLYSQFLTDTEVAVLLLDLYSRDFKYPMEYIIEALAPTTEHDFECLPVEKQKIYRYIQSQHMSASPDGPWFFIIARNNPYKKLLQLIGITDTSMLRPQVFAMQEGEEQIALVCSEKQAIDATLQNITAEDSRFCPVADKYWNARGGSATDGGSFTFTVKDSEKNDGKKELVVTNKFDEVVEFTGNKDNYQGPIDVTDSNKNEALNQKINAFLESGSLSSFKSYCKEMMASWDYDDFASFCNCLEKSIIDNDDATSMAINLLIDLNDSSYPISSKKRGSILDIVRSTLSSIFKSLPALHQDSNRRYAYIDWESREMLRSPLKNEKILVVNAKAFEPEGINCDSRLVAKAYELGWKQFICFGYKGQRFTGCAFGKGTEDVRIDVFDSSGDYLASGIDGMELYVHGNAQDQVAQIMKGGKLVIYGDVGQTFMYGAKGGEVYVLGNAAGRPLINGTGSPKVIINGSCLDYLAESFMAGDPLNGGGFAILNGLIIEDDGQIVDHPTSFQGSNLFSLASGGAIYLRDPHKKVVEAQLNGGEFTELSDKDWDVIYPYLAENERLFDISVDNNLLTIDGNKMDYKQVYRKIQAI